MRLRFLALAAALAALPIAAHAQSTSYRSARVLTPGVMGKLASNWRAACSSAGWVRLVLIDGSTYDVLASVGTGGEDGIGIMGVAATGAPSPAANCIVSVLSNPNPETGQ